MQPETQAPAPAGGETRTSTDIWTVVLLYAVFAALWILLSDKAVEWLFDDPAKIVLAEIVTGPSCTAKSSETPSGSLLPVCSPRS